MESSSSFGADEIRWDLDDLKGDPGSVEATLEQARADASTFAERYRGRIPELDAEALAEALAQLESIKEELGRVHAYAYLHWSTDTSDPKRGALLQSVREAYNRINQDLLFVEVEWAEVSDERTEALLQDEALAEYRHFLELQHLQKEHTLSEPEEKVLSEKSVTGKQAWTRFFDETVGAIRVDLDGKELSQEEALSKLYEPNRFLRKQAAHAFTGELKSHIRTFTFTFNTLLAEKASTDRLRGYDHWLESRNLANEVDDETVETLVEAVTGRYDLVARFYRLKQRLLELDELYDYDRYAPVKEVDTTYDWDEARSIVLAGYHDFHPDMAAVAERFFDNNWIDAAVEPGKRSGAFSHPTVPGAHPYVLLNYTGKTRDVQTLAHELGHGVHQYLAREQSLFHHGTPLTTAEMASVFGERLVFRRLLNQESNPANRLALLVGKIDDTLATVFRQVAMNRFEDRIHRARRSSGELATDAFCRHWMETQKAMFGDSVTLGEHYRYWWSYVPHFLHTPGYVYAYAFGELLVLALYDQYRDARSGFADRYLDVLRAGGSDWPHELLAEVGVDPEDDELWHRGLRQIESLIARAEALAETVEVGAATPQNGGASPVQDAP